MTIHLEPRHLKIVQDILHSYPGDYYVFGSRATGKHRPLSDLDLLCKSLLTKLQRSELNEKFEESSLPFKVDLVLWGELDESFRRHIQQDLTLFV